MGTQYSPLSRSAVSDLLSLPTLDSCDLTQTLHPVAIYYIIKIRAVRRPDRRLARYGTRGSTYFRFRLFDETANTES